MMNRKGLPGGKYRVYSPGWRVRRDLRIQEGGHPLVNDIVNKMNFRPSPSTNCEV